MRDVDFANRIGVSPMCQYSSIDGYANDWHCRSLASPGVSKDAVLAIPRNLGCCISHSVSPNLRMDYNCANQLVHTLVHTG
jgi:hypothetical protein